MLPEEIDVRIAKQLARRARTGLVAIAANHGPGDLVELAHHEPGGARDLVGHREDRRLERVAVPVRHAEEGLQWPESRHSDGDVDEAFPPRAAERVGDDHADL